MSAASPEATGDDSRGRAGRSDAARPERIGLLLRWLLALAGVAGGIFLVLATSATIIDVSIGTTGGSTGTFDTALSGADRHGPALVIIAVLAMVLLVAAVQGVRAAMFAIAVCGVVVLGISILSDARNIDDTGQLRQLYTGAIAGAGNGFYFETLGGALLLISGGGLLVLSGGSPAEPAGPPRPGRRAPRRHRRTLRKDPVAPSPSPGPAPETRAESRVDDWFSE